MTKLLKIIALLCLFSVGFLGCKKYPENKLLFADPKKCFKGGIITEYSISGVDHISDITALYKYFPYNFYGKPIENALELPFTYNKGDDTFSCEYGEGLFEFAKNKKSIEIHFKPINHEFGAQNIFVADAKWDILKLTKSGQLRIKSYINSKTYIIQFN